MSNIINITLKSFIDKYILYLENNIFFLNEEKNILNNIIYR